jgi:hypothetical protein
LTQVETPKPWSPIEKPERKNRSREHDKKLRDEQISERRAGADLLSAVTRRQVKRLESAPVPVTGNRGSNLSRLSIGLGVFRVARLRHGNTDLLSIHAVLNLVKTIGAILLPAQVGAPAQITSTGRNTVGVETSILV